MNQHHQILIIGAGTAGITVAAQLKNKDKKLDIAIIDPSEYHYYQPAWTLVGAGVFDFEKTKRKQSDYIPKGVKWLKDSVIEIKPDNNSLSTQQNGNITYDYLVVAPGLVMAPELLEGLPEALNADNVCSNYIDPKKTWKLINNFKGGNAVFTQPTTPIKCGGAPQKIMYLAEEYFRKKSGVRNDTNVIFATPGSVIFGVKEFANTLNKIIYDRDIILKTYYSPTRIDSKNNKIYFHYSKPGENACIVTEDNKIQEEIHGVSEIAVPYDILHIAPPQKAPDFVCKSKLAYQDGPNKGWLNVDIYSLQNNDFPNVFALGDVAALPTAKTGAAVRKQAPVVVENILKLIEKNNLSNKVYKGYSSCPLVTGFSKMVLAEFKYNNVRDSDPLISTFIDTTKEQYSMWLLKKYALPYMYWNLMLRGKA